jgi:hypothetical protein
VKNVTSVKLTVNKPKSPEFVAAVRNIQNMAFSSLGTKVASNHAL